ncbi:MAG TPA: hypothetical protein VHE30_17770 [Polyangiaceae bacterium]|nr:hypothetical protein [Polyangiaceae bacterium]
MALAGALTAGGCHESSTPGNLGSETNWLHGCRGAEDCSVGECLCGICTSVCAGAADCSGAVCATRGEERFGALCGSTSSADGVCAAACERNGDCAAGTRCVSGLCSAAAESPGARDASVDAPSSSSCNDWPVPVDGPRVQVSGLAFEPLPGGTILDGVYDLIGATAYVPGSPDGGSYLAAGRAEAIVVSGSTWSSVAYWDDSPTVRHRFTFSVAGSSIHFERTCGDADSGPLFGSDGTFRATPLELILRLENPPGFSSGVAVLSYQRIQAREGGVRDGGFSSDWYATCDGMTCASSTDCHCGPAEALSYVMVPPFGIACGASGTCESCRKSGLGDPCTGGGCCPGLRCVGGLCTR